MGPGGKWIKLFLCSEEVASLTMDSLSLRIQERFPSLKRNTVNVKYHDGKAWIDLPSDDVDSVIDMIETAQQERENLKRITLQQPRSQGFSLGDLARQGKSPGNEVDPPSE